MRCVNCGKEVGAGKTCNGKIYCDKCCDKFCYIDKQKKPPIHRDIL